MCALRHPRRDGPEPSAICRSRVRPHDATNVLVAVEHIVVVVSPCAHRWRACCRGSWAIDDELGELRGIAGAFFHFKYHFNTTTTQKLAIPSTNNQPVF